MTLGIRSKLKGEMSQLVSYEEYQKHLKMCADEVKTWPDWMREGARVSMGLAQRRKEREAEDEPNRTSH